MTEKFPIELFLFSMKFCYLSTHPILNLRWKTTHLERGSVIVPCCTTGASVR